jgi:hypothetical protein
VNLYNATLEKQSVYKPELVLEKGMYIVRIYTGTKLYVSKLVVQ